MALKTYVSPGVYDTHIGTTTITATGVAVTTGGIFSATFTAPNTTNACTGVWIFFNAVASTGNITLTLQESIVDKVSATINLADMKAGYNYVRFGTPYVFTTIAAGAYRFKANNTSTNSGSLRIGASGFMYSATYNTATTLGSTDDLWVGGFNNSGLTPMTCTLSGTLSLGSGTDKTMTTATNATVGAGITIGNGGTVRPDDTVNTTVTLRGSTLQTLGGTLAWQANTSDKTKIAKLIFDCETANGNYLICNASGIYGGIFLIEGANYDRINTYVSGLGTAASPFIVSTPWDADVGDEILVAGGTDYLKNEVRFIKTKNSSTSFVLSTTPGGAEAALTQTHAVGSHVGNMASNCIVTSLTTTRGYYISNATTNPTYSSLNNSRLEYTSGASGHGVNVEAGTTTLDAYATCNNMVVYQNSLGNRTAITFQATNVSQTINGIITYNTLATNGAGAGSLGLVQCSNKVFNNCLFANGANSNTGGVLLGVSNSSTNNTFNNVHMYGGNSSGSGSNSALYINSAGNTFNDCSINATRVQGILLAGGTGNNFNSFNSGNIATNTIDITTSTATLNTAVFYDSNFGSATLISNYLNSLTGSDIAFQNMDANTSKHRWYTNTGWFSSAGAGLADTTVRTATSLALAIKPQNNTLGAELFFKVPANAMTQVTISGYLYRNATFSSGTLKVDLFLPGTLLTDTPDDTQIMPTTTGAWLPFNLSAYYSANDSRYAIVRVTAITATVGAYAFMDDLYDAGTSNKVAGLDVWDEGHISPIMVANDFSVVASTVWGYPDTNTQAGTMGQRQVDAVDNQILPNLLIKDKLS